MIPLYTFDHALFLALNFDGGPVMDRLMTLVSGTAMWLPLYALILWLVWRREGWRRTLLFAAAIVLAIVLADMAAGIFKHYIHIVAQLAEAAAADVPHRAVCQRHGKAACAVVIHSQSVHSLSC